MKAVFTVLVLALVGVAYARTLHAPAPAPQPTPEIEQAVAVVSCLFVLLHACGVSYVLLDLPSNCVRAAVLQNQTRMLAWHNAYRAQHHVPALKWNAQVR